MSLSHLIEAHRDDPEVLEKLYRTSPEVFKASFDEVYQRHLDSIVLGVWHARLAHEKPASLRDARTFIQRPSELLAVVLIGLVGGTLARLSAWMDWGEALFYARNAAFFILPGLAFYFALRNAAGSGTGPGSESGAGRSLYIGLALMFAGALVYINALPFDTSSDTMLLACIHLPFFLWALAGIAYAGMDYCEPVARMSYLKFNGEMLIYAALILLGGMLLTGLTMALFGAIGWNIEQWYGENVVIYGLFSTPIVAAYITMHRANAGQRIAPAIAKIFSPLVLITLVVFLVANALQGKSPYTDRNFLIVFNAMLMVVLAITVFTISERPSAESRIPSDYVAYALVVVALMVDLIALSAIVFRLSSYGLTPNRLVVLGANLLVFGNLAGILFYYTEFLRGRVDIEHLETWIARYLPLYAVWTVFIVFIMPALFGFA